MASANYSVANLDRFLLMAGEKGLIHPGTAKALRVAANKVLHGVEEHEQVDVREIDREAVFNRFQNLHGMKYSPESLTTYRSRFTSALDAFINYVGNPASYKPHSKKPGTVAAKAVASKKKNSSIVKSAAGTAVSPTLPVVQQADSLMIPIPIREGTMVRIFGVPGNLTQEEAKKIAAVIQAYAVG